LVGLAAAVRREAVAAAAVTTAEAEGAERAAVEAEAEEGPRSSNRSRVPSRSSQGLIRAVAKLLSAIRALLRPAFILLGILHQSTIRLRSLLS
jgi:hypothetical protein